MTANSTPSDQIRAARQQLVLQGLIRADLPASLVSAEIERSWRRSISCGVDGEVLPEFLGESNLDATLLGAADRILDQWKMSLSDSRMSLLLADRNGRIISRRVVDARDRDDLDRVNATEGFNYSEEALGTNGLGTPIEAREVVFVRGSEHFNEALSQLACAGAPIFHPLTGRAIGSISFAANLDASVPLMVGMVRQASQQISGEMQATVDSRDLDLARAYRRLKSSRRPVLVLNTETVMTDLPALSHFGAEFHAVLWEELRRHRWDEGTLRLNLPLFGTDTIVRRLQRDNGEDIFAIEFPESAGQPASASKRHSPSPSPSITGPVSTTLYGEVAEQLSVMAEATGVLRLIGPPGVGKRYQAAKWLRQRTGQEAIVFDAQTDPTREELEVALEQGRGVIIVSPGGVRDQLWRRLDQLARQLPAGAHPGARIVLTQHPDDGFDASGQTDASLTVVMSPLAQIHADIPAIIRDVVAELYPSAPAPRFSPATLQRLLAWSWPGNIGELRRVLIGLPQLGRGELIQVDDLPVSLRRSLDPNLSRYERSERETITAVLRETGGNKSQAAATLGIGRTTLYRKMRMLKISADEWAVTDNS